MHQIGNPIPATARTCGEGHRPQLVESRGTPRGLALLCGRVPPQFHVECARCNTATVPAKSRTKALQRWNANLPSINQIPLSELAAARERAFAATATAA